MFAFIIKFIIIITIRNAEGVLGEGVQENYNCNYNYKKMLIIAITEVIFVKIKKIFYKYITNKVGEGSVPGGGEEGVKFIIF